MPHVFIIFLLCLLRSSVLKADNRLLHINNVDKYLDMCPESYGLKDHPTPEPTLQCCSEWRERACCPYGEADQHADEFAFGFTFNFCDNGMTSECKQFFDHEFCLVRCSPHLGPWIVQTSSKKFKESLFKIPLCETDCNEWYDACKDSKACATNWRSGGFDWSTGTNKCREGYGCIAISKIYGSAKHFCERVWDDRYFVVPSDSVQEWNVTDFHCMHIPRGKDASEDKRIVEHNEGVARRQAEAIIKRVYG
ncbi:hypothetical protein Aperf_G00000022255 [Anoplocephala perfoliata]